MGSAVRSRGDSVAVNPVCAGDSPHVLAAAPEVAGALYYAENASESGAWTRADQRAFDQLWRRLESRP